ncbi:hypothetical protein VP01_5004g1 [Puccinia sorghi]|uniref:Retrotransposon gag domain-containing protein n=1 Tax=Puccinia sorghi TaxID=27349 RepID=A0A0L6UNN9_9BASI|nr:hypothetical protein VP01_5004g1 [Puccinia sorghi]
MEPIASGSGPGNTAPVEDCWDRAPKPVHLHDVPPHIQPTLALRYQPPTTQEFSHLSRLEPLKLLDVWFSGNASNLTLPVKLSGSIVTLDIDHPRIARFLPPPRIGTTHWLDNACRKGVLDPYADHDGVELIRPTLLSAQAFLEGLISVFDNRFMKENAKCALNACKKRNLTIGKYNSQLSSLVYLVEDVKETRIKKYVAGLNPLIIWHAMSSTWRQIKTLDDKMAIAAKSAVQLNLLAELPEVATGTPYQPLSSNRPGVISHPFPQLMKDPNAMEGHMLGV